MDGYCLPLENPILGISPRLSIAGCVPGLFLTCLNLLSKHTSSLCTWPVWLNTGVDGTTIGVPWMFLTPSFTCGQALISNTTILTRNPQFFCSTVRYFTTCMKHISCYQYRFLPLYPLPFCLYLTSSSEIFCYIMFWFYWKLNLPFLILFGSNPATLLAVACFFQHYNAFQPNSWLAFDSSPLIHNFHFTDYHVMCCSSLKNQDQGTGSPDPIFADLFWIL